MTYPTREQAMIVALAISDEGDEVWLHQADCSIEPDECTCAPEVYVMAADRKLVAIGSMQGRA